MVVWRVEGRMGVYRVREFNLKSDPMYVPMP